MPKKIILSGIQPTGGIPHIGNYFGALSNWIKLQHPSNKILYSIVDLHAITKYQDPNILHTNIKDMAVSLLACGVDPNQSCLFRQSKIRQHSELSWILSCNTQFSWLSRMTAWKSKLSIDGAESTQSTQSISDQSLISSKTLQLGLFAYPVLQTADILLYQATHVPVGQDQKQHLELAATIATSFNKKYGKVFQIPSPIFPDEGSGTSRIMSLSTPSRKMSKSDQNQNSRINLNDREKKIKSKIMKATTDSIIGITYDPINRPGISNLLSILSGCTDTSPEILANEYANASTATFKGVVADALVEKLTPIQKEMDRIRKDGDYIEKVLQENEDKARALAEVTLVKVHKAIGLISK